MNRDEIKDALKHLLFQSPLHTRLIFATKLIPTDMPYPFGVKLNIGYIEMYYSPKVIAEFNLTKSDLIEILKHEYAHILLKHVNVPLKDPHLDNIAADIEINQAPWVDLEKTRFIRENGYTYDSFHLEEKKTREYYYEKLLLNLKTEKNENENSEKGNKNEKKESDSDKKDNENNISDNENNKNIDTHEYWHKNPIVKAYWENVIMEAIEEAKNKGYIPGDTYETIRAAWKRNKKLEKILMRIYGKYISQYSERTLTRMRPNRRNPLWRGKRDRYGAKIVWAIDTSGSMSTNEIAEIVGVIKWISKRVKVDVIQCDAQVTDAKMNIKIGEKLQIKGRGGTSFVPVFEYIEKKYKNKIDLLIYATDLDGTFPKTIPPYKTLWLSRSNKKAPFGEIIKITDNEI